jgi:hypothetical protein
MISNQIALKPFLQKVATADRMSYPEMIKGAAQDAASQPVEEFLQDKQVQGMADFAKVLRVNASQVAEVQADLAAEKVDPRMATVFINNMVITAFAMEPGSAVALDGAMRLIMMGEEPLSQSAVEDGTLKLSPGVARSSQQMELGENGMVSFLAENFKENPVPDERAQFQIDSSKKLASVLRLDEKEVEQYRTQFAQQGLNSEQSEGALGLLVMNAVAQEPTFRNTLGNGIAMIQMRQPEGLGESFFEKA